MINLKKTAFPLRREMGYELAQEDLRGLARFAPRIPSGRRPSLAATGRRARGTGVRPSQRSLELSRPERPPAGADAQLTEAFRGSERVI